MWTLPLRVVLLLLLGRCSPPAAAQGTAAALTPAQAGHAFYCAGMEGNEDDDDMYGVPGLQGIWVNATSNSACDAGPAAVLRAFIGLINGTTPTLACSVSGGMWGDARARGWEELVKSSNPNPRPPACPATPPPHRRACHASHPAARMEAPTC